MADTKAPSLVEYAGIRGGKDYTRGFVGIIQNFLPSQDSLLEQKSGGDLELYEIVATDDQVKSCLQQRFRALLSKDWEVIPGGEKRIDKQAAEHLTKQLQAIDWDGKSEKMLWGIHYGYSAAEVLWKRSNDKVEISDIRVRNRRRFHFNEDQKLVLKTMQQPLGEDLPERKFWHFCTGADHDDEPYGRGLGYWLYWPTFFKRQGVRWWMKFVEKYASPTRLGKFPAGATPEEKAVLWNALASFGDDARSMIPEGLTMEFLESSRAGTVDYKALCDQMDGAIAKIILSQTMTTDDGSSKSQAEVHEGVKDEVIESDSDLLSESFNNSVAVWLTDWNFPGAAYPKVRRKLRADPDPATMADTDTKLQGLGISLKPEAIAAKYGQDYLIPENKDSVPHSTGEQVNALVSIITNAKQGGWSDKLVAGIINGAFPNWPDTAVAAITSNLDSPDPANPSVEGVPEQAEAVEVEFAMSDLEVEFKIPEGTIKEKNGKKYVLTNSRWRLADKEESKPRTKTEPKEKKPKAKATPKKKALSDKSKAIVEDVQKAAGVTPKAKTTPKKKADKQEPPKLIAPVDNIDRITAIEKAVGADMMRQDGIMTKNTNVIARVISNENEREAFFRLIALTEQKAAILAVSLDVNQATRLSKIVDDKDLIANLSKLPDGHIVAFHPGDRELFDRNGLKPVLAPKSRRGMAIDPKYPYLIARVKDGKLESIPQSEVKKVADIRKAREKATENMEKIHFDNNGIPRGAEGTSVLQNILNRNASAVTPSVRAKIYASEDKHHEKIDKLENAYLGRKPTGNHGDYASYEQRSRDWAKAKFGDFNEGANGFSLAQTKAHDIAHPVTHDLIGMDSDKIHKHFGKMKDATGKDALYAEEAIVNVMEQLSRGVSIEAATLNGVRLARVMTRGGVGSKEAAEYVRSPEFAQKLTQAANHAYRHDDFAPLIAHVRKSNRLSGTVTAAGDNFSNSASGG